ncbi:MAG: hypothetical protein BA864_05105 [Desulfuromonadales bacterium C00003093]|nr:MAG: hypothetical protein BA864_05105 [Desulfuromonadales bacterium C00003093]
MAYITTISFREEDEELIEFLKKRSGIPTNKRMTGLPIRERLYDYMELKRGDELRHAARTESD